MSYEDLVSALIENQEQVLGDQALDIAKEVSGIQFDGDDVSSVDGQDAVIELVNSYEEQMGDAAMSSLRVAASNFQDEVDLPSKLQL